MKSNNQSGFSLIELLLVCVIIGIVASISFPYLKKAKYASENGAMLATLRTMAQGQIDFYTHNSRYATLAELNTAQSNVYGTYSSGKITRGNFTLDMRNPTDLSAVTASTDTSLKTDFLIYATKTADALDVPYVIRVNASAQIVQITP